MSSAPDEAIRDKPTASVLTLGCKVNQFESAAMTQFLRQSGYSIVKRGEPSDFTLLNTCTVTHKADAETRSIIRRVNRNNPRGRIWVTGCQAQVQPEKLADLPGVALVFGQTHKADFYRFLDKEFPEKIMVRSIRADQALSPLGFPSFGRTRAFFRIQDGCSAVCSYCIVPRTRGPSRSLAADDVIRGVIHYARKGYAEVVLTGIHLGAWGEDLSPARDLTGLLEKLVGKSFGRVRLSSIEPNEVTDGLVHLISTSDKICPHLHLPLQSGSDRILAAMRRPYTRAFFSDLVTRLANGRSDFSLGVDILTGFPGENEEAFSETVDLVTRLPISYFHVFSYSPRPRTTAVSNPDRVSPREIKRRVAFLRRLGEKKRAVFKERSLGQIRPTLIENTADKATGLPRGLTDNYIQVLVPEKKLPAGRIRPVRLTEIAPDGRVVGRLA